MNRGTTKPIGRWAYVNYTKGCISSPVDDVKHRYRYHSGGERFVKWILYEDTSYEYPSLWPWYGEHFSTQFRIEQAGRL